MPGIFCLLIPNVRYLVLVSVLVKPSTYFDSCNYRVVVLCLSLFFDKVQRTLGNYQLIFDTFIGIWYKLYSLSLD